MKSRTEMTGLTEQQKDRFACALQRVGGDEEMLVVLAEMAAEDAPVLLDKLAGEIQAGFSDAAGQTAHALKGLLSTFETGFPVEELQPLIDAARVSDDDETSRLFKGLKPRLLKLIAQVDELTKPS